MAPRSSLSLPTASALPSSNRFPAAHPTVARALIKLSRPSLLALVQEWLKPSNQSTCAPVLSGAVVHDDSPYDPAHSLDELRHLYGELEKRKGGKREVVDRVVEGDWRHGLSLRQLAMVDVQYLLDHPTSQRWTALNLVRTASEERSTEDLDTDRLDGLPRFHGPTFLRKLQKEVGPFARAHYHLRRLPSMPITLLRIFIHDFPYNNSASLVNAPSTTVPDTSNIIYLAFPHNTSSVFISLTAIPGPSSRADGKSLRRIIIDAVPIAFSRPRERYALTPTSLSARSLSSLASLRGSGRGVAAAGGWSIFAEGTVEKSPLIAFVPSVELSYDEDGCKENMSTSLPKDSSRKRQMCDGDVHRKLSEGQDVMRKRHYVIAKSRFGESGVEGDGKGIERLDIRLEDPFTADIGQDPPDPQAEPAMPTKAARSRRGRRSTFSMLEDTSMAGDELAEADAAGARAPAVQLTFHGAHVFAGIRKLVESGAVDGRRMPGWMSGENGVSTGAVRHGRIRGNQGSGLWHGGRVVGIGGLAAAGV